MGITEFQAVLMAAGKGSRMTELTLGIPKCLLPIGNQPMMWYSLQMLERAGFQDVIVVVQESTRADVQTALDRCGLKIRLDIVEIPGGDDLGTAESLRFIAKKITSDVLVVSCDLITDYNLRELLDVFRQHQASIATLFFPATTEVAGTVPGPKTKHKPERDFVGIDPATSRLVFLRSASDFKETVALSSGLLRKHHRITMHSRMTDSHIYVFRKWVCDFLIHERSFSTLKGEFLPYIVKQQLVRVKPAETELNTSLVNQDTKRDILQYAAESCLDAKVRHMSTYNDHTGDMRPAYLDDVIRCYAVVAGKNTFGMRANTLPAFTLANNKILDKWDGCTGGRALIPVSAGAEVRSTQVDGRCLVADGAVLAEKTSFSATFVGLACNVSAKVRLANCVLMNSVTIEEGCVLNNCIVCDSAVINKNCDLRDCLVGSNHIVPEGSKHANEALTEMDSLMEI